MSEISREKMLKALDVIKTEFNEECWNRICDAIRDLIENRPKVPHHKDGWWIHLVGKNGRVADFYLGKRHGPIVESVLKDNEAGVEVEE